MPELFQSLANILKGLRPRGEEALECDAQIRFQDIALPLLGLPAIQVVGAGNRIASLVFGQIHRRVRNLNQLLRRRAVQRESGQANACGGVLFL